MESGNQGLGRRAWMLLFAAALALRLGAIAVAGGSTLRFGDARAYIAAADTLVRTGHYPRQTDYFSFRAPGYPVFLVAVTMGHPKWVLLAKTANAVLGSLSVLLLAAVAGRLFHRRRVTLAVGVAAAADPASVLTTTDVQSEPLFVFLLLAAGFLLIVAVDRPSSNFGLFSGAALAAAALTRPSALALAPLLCAPLCDRRYPKRARGHLAASALLGFGLALAPWTIRNAIVYRELLPVNDFAGINLYLGNSDLWERFYRVRTRSEYEAWIRELDRLTRERFAELQKTGETSPTRRSLAFWRMTLAERRANPDGTVSLLLHKTWDWLRPYPHPLFWPPWVVWPSGIFYGALSVCALIGWSAAPRPGVRLFIVFYLALTLAVHLALIVVWRYRIAYWNPVLLLYGVFGAAVLLEQGKRMPGDVRASTSTS
jgi:4-amino-4-deoxy-L-arabinose transferase-like glycosyltransferase